MDKFIVTGGRKLKGKITVSGSKNVALKVLVASCLTDEEVVIENIPLISDFMVMADIIRELGGSVDIKDHTARVRVENLKKSKISLDKAAAIRTSSMFLAPLLVRLGKALIPNPGGCRIGARPIDRIIKGIEKMGVEVSYKSRDGFFYLNVSEKLKPIKYKFEKNTHTGTETLILLSVLIKGKTVLENAAQEPEVDDLIEFLNLMGADVKRIKPRTIAINGVEKLHGAKFIIPSDRNEIITFAIASVMTKGDIFIENINVRGLEEFIDVFKKTGGGLEISKNKIRFFYKGELKPTTITTGFYPGFMTDWQGPWAVMMTQANGISTIHERVYENRFFYVGELEKMGADIELFNPKINNPNSFYNFNYEDNKPEYKHAARILGPMELHNGVIEISDLRAGATLVLAALSAAGESIIFGIEHLDRGYEGFEKRLKTLGAKIRREKE
ncbi:MAG: UDP-N-acetylglucosamine 1-carboxyvinyltransferase [Patescibacteria group bacterium]